MRSPTGLDSLDGHAPDTPAVHIDISRRYVRFRERRENGYVEFDFSIGDPALSVELVMSQACYEAFCAANRVTYLSVDEGAAIDADQHKWRYGVPGLTE